MDTHPQSGVANPALLLIPQGPGLPLIQEADDFQHSTHKRKGAGAHRRPSPDPRPETSPPYALSAKSSVRAEVPVEHFKFFAMQLAEPSWVRSPTNKSRCTPRCRYRVAG